MRQLNSQELQMMSQMISGGAYSQMCYEAYKNHRDNLGIVDLLGVMFLPFIFIPKWMGEINLVKNICGGWEGYEQAVAQYCHENPKRCEKHR